MLAAMDDVAGKTAEAEGELSAEVKERTDENEESAEKKKGAAEFAKGIHGKEFRRNEVKK